MPSDEFIVERKRLQKEFDSAMVVLKAPAARDVPPKIRKTQFRLAENALGGIIRLARYGRTDGDVTFGPEREWLNEEKIQRGFHTMLNLLADIRRREGIRHATYPIYRAMLAGDDALATRLQTTYASLDVRDGSGETPLTKAASRGQDSLIMNLLDMGVDIAAENIYNRTALHEAILYRRKNTPKIRDMRLS